MERPDWKGRLEAAKARLDRLDLYPEPVRLEGVRVEVVPWVFGLPGLRRYSGYTLWRTILLRRGDATDDLLTHELCHIWQMQQRPAAAMFAWLRYAYAENPLEREAWEAVRLTRDGDDGLHSENSRFAGT
jgi:hypothetical protein